MAETKVDYEALILSGKQRRGRAGEVNHLCVKLAEALEAHDARITELEAQARENETAMRAARKYLGYRTGGHWDRVLGMLNARLATCSREKEPKP